ncbi:transcription elongation factor GreA [candidate division WS5 bacterium]|uniref:Transcription elongation factor GreA n=1 Tax=candidate division WS5 bacterium TaxID=2093353 RepID=A0A419DAJ5_9BACT|nr:MAG: transcription elongation factor GreA [candidate division WS5 bacterium]
MDKDIYISKDGLNKLQEEVSELTTVKKKEVAARIKAAKEFGDLSENSEYDDAKNEQAFIEGRISEIEHILKNAKIIEEVACKTTDKVCVGHTVVVDLKGGEAKFKIVGSYEADPEMGLISNESPIGQALLGKEKGAEISVQVPAGDMKYKIKDILE